MDARECFSEWFYDGEVRKMVAEVKMDWNRTRWTGFEQRRRRVDGVRIGEYRPIRIVRHALLRTFAHCDPTLHA